MLLPALREIDLYSLQGVVKAEVATAAAEDRERMSAQLAAWKAAPAAFELDGHAPVRELWHRASLAWQEVLSDKAKGAKAAPKGQERATLLVAHNAVNQALLGTAAGWGPDAFRRFEQSNGALTVRPPLACTRADHAR
jgi:probable phosphoglycerate mutase